MKRRYTWAVHEFWSGTIVMKCVSKKEAIDLAGRFNELYGTPGYYVLPI